MESRCALVRSHHFLFCSVVLGPELLNLASIDLNALRPRCSSPENMRATHAQPLHASAGVLENGKLEALAAVPGRAASSDPGWPGSRQGLRVQVRASR